MLNLVPDFIINKYKDNLFRGRINAFCLFADIVGFTCTTEKLMKYGNEGADVLSKILKEIFSNTVDTIHSSGGFITHFAGDGFFALYEFDDQQTQKIQLQNSLSSAYNILQKFILKPRHTTSLGDFKFTIKIGISCGEVLWAITGSNVRSFYFKGRGINGAVISEGKASRNEIIIDNNIFEMSDSKDIVCENIDSSFYRIKNIRFNSSQKLPTSYTILPFTKEIFIKNFVTEQVYSVKDPGEFRYVASIFISYEGLNDEETDNYISYLCGEFIKYNGHLKDIEFADKGNLIVGFFGAPVSTENNISIALDFVINIFQSSRKVINNQELKLKAGITYGQVYAGFIGGVKRAQYSCIGDIVNLASRLVTASEWGQILVDNSISSASGNWYNFVKSGKIKLKGFEQPIEVYELLNKHTEKSDKEIEIPFVGREKEIELLHEKVSETCKAKTGKIVFVNGEAGIGKSKLASELQKRISVYPESLWLHLPGNENVPQSLYPFRLFFTNFFEITQDLAILKKRKLFNSKLDKIIKLLQKKQDDESIKEISQSVKEIDRTKSILASLADVYWEDSLYEQLAPSLRMDNVFFAVCNFISSLGYIYNIILEFDNVHTLDKETIQLIKYLTQYSKNKPVFFLCTGRYFDDGTKFSSKLQVDIPSVEIELPPLETDNIIILSEKLLGSLLDKPSVSLLKERTNGNPYFIEQMVLDLNERGQIKVVDGKFTLSSSELSARPTSLNSILTSRFDRLPAEVKTIVQHSSVLGRKIDIRILSLMLGSPDKMEENLKTALQNNVLVKNNETTYTFYHDLLRNAVYDMHLKSSLTELHLLAANSYISFFDNKFTLQSQEQYSFHLGIGYGITNQNEEIVITSGSLNDEKLKENALTYLNLQKDLADQYEHLYYNDDAIRKYKLIVQLFKLLSFNSETADYLIRQGEILKLIGKYDEAMKLFNEALNIANIIQRNIIIAQAYLSIAMIYERQGDFDKAQHSCIIANKLFSQSGFKKGEAISIGFLGYIEQYKSNFNKALEYYKKRLKLCKLNNDSIGTIDTHNDIGTLYLTMGQYEKALKNYFKSLKLSRNLNYKLGTSRVLGNIGIVFVEQYDYSSAMEYYKKKMKLCSKIGDKREIWKAYVNIANVLKDSGNFTKALKYYEKQFIICNEIKDKFGIMSYYMNIQEAYSNTGLLDKSIEALRKAYDLAMELNSKPNICEVLLLQINYYINLQNINKAKELLIKGLQISEQNQFQEYILYFKLSKAKIMYLEGFQKASINLFNDLIKVNHSDEFFANVVYDLLTLTKQDGLSSDFETMKKRTIEIYNKLLEKTSKFKYKQRISELLE